MKKKKKYYAVKKGRTPGIYFRWADCKSQVDGFSNAVYKNFESIQEAEAFVIGDLCDSGEMQFQKEGQAVAYVDGSYHAASGEYSCGIVFFFDGKEEHLSEKGNEPDLAAMRNVAGEILGAQRAMEHAIRLGAKDLKIYHDYQGISSWCLGEWKTNKKGTKEYKAYFDSIQGILDVQFVKVKGHSGDQYNDLADELARNELDLGG